MAKAPGIGERACPKCKETIKVNAQICKHCRTEFTEEEVAAAKADNAKTAKFAGFGCLTLVVLLGFCALSGGEPDVPEKPAGTAKADAIAFYHKVIETAKPCQAAGQALAEAGTGGDPVALYQATDKVESACLSTGSDIAAIEVPVSVGKDAYKQLTEAREVCQHAYVARWSGAGTMKDALDNPGSVSKMAELKSAMKLVEDGTMACGFGIVIPATALGATEADLGLKAAAK